MMNSKPRCRKQPERRPPTHVAFIKLKSVFGDLADNARFAETYQRMLTQIYSNPDVSILMRQVTV